MARYEYRCPECDTISHRVVHLFKMADEQFCDNEPRFGEEEEDENDPDTEDETVCGAKLERVLFPKERVCSVAYHGEGWQMGAVMGDGSTVPGHFGRDAARKRKK